MGKRKRDAAENERAHSGKSKKVKAQEQEATQSKSDIGDWERLHPRTEPSPLPNNVQPAETEEQAALTRKLHKREKKRIKRKQQVAQQAQGERADGGHVRSGELVKSKKGKSKHDKQRKGRESEGSGWKTSDPVGGRLLDLDPVFSSDEEHLLLAYESAIVIYSTATSLPVRHLRVKTGDKISAFAISSLSEHELYVSTTFGTIERWDWSRGLRLGHWKLSSAIYSLTTSARTTSEANSDLVYTVDRKDGEPPLLSAHRLNDEPHFTKTEVKTLLNNGLSLSLVKILEGGRFILATSGFQLIIGYSNTPNPAVLQGLIYTWRTVECPEYIVSIDARISHPKRESKKSKGGKRRIESLDIAVGGLKGAIHIYENLLGHLISREQPTSKDSSEIVRARRLHWHRNAVLALKWSLDGNYLISGGEETVLLLSQLETGSKQDLPHLGAPIESIVVSPSGSSYGIRLADNSAMILSTTELRPTFSTAGIQLPAATKPKGIEMPFVPTVSAPLSTTKSVQSFNVPACISPLHPGSLLLAVQPSIPFNLASATSPNKSYLQTFDLGTSQQISRQALVRTKVTTLNMGPQSNIIEEPNVTHIQTSADGRWLASVDEWMPPKSDLVSLTFDQERLTEEQIFRQEIHLKFWSWKDETKVWELVSRIDNPHASQSGNPYERGNVLDLASDPSSIGFATVGADGIVKTWKPAIRRRHGLYVRGNNGQSLTSWHCKHVVPLELTELSTDRKHQNAKLTYSRDGSILVGALESAAITSPVYIIDTYNGEIQSMQSGLYNGPLLGLGIVDKCLITLSQELYVLDLVNDELVYGIDLQSHGLSLNKQRSGSHLAVDVQQGLFAVAVPELIHTANNVTELRSQLAVFDPADATPRLLTSVLNNITRLLPIAGRRGFIAIDSAAEVKTFSPSQSLPLVPIANVKAERKPPRGIGDVFGVKPDTAASEDGASKSAGLLEPKFNNITHEPHVSTDDTIVVSQEKLAEVFDVGPAYALPPVTDLFEQVAGLYNGRTLS